MSLLPLYQFDILFSAFHRMKHIDGVLVNLFINHFQHVAFRIKPKSQVLVEIVLVSFIKQGGG
jgi:hypothetical protein